MFPDEYVQPDEGSDSLIGVDGNAFAIMGHTSRLLKRAGNPPSVVNGYRDTVMSSNYDDLVAVSMAYLDGDPVMLKNIVG